MLSCKQASQLVSQSLDRKLNTRERFALKLHLFICKYCTRFSQQLVAMRVAMLRNRQTVENDTNVTLSTEAKARITQALNKS
jgi:Putative zinc-finger